MAHPRPNTVLPKTRLASPSGSLVTVGEALCSCDPEELCCAVLRHQAGWSVDPARLGARRLRPLVSRVRAALRSMEALRARKGTSPGGQVVLPLESFRALGPPGSLIRRMGAAQVSLASASAAADALAVCGGPAWGALPPDAARLLEGLGPDVPWAPAALGASLRAWGDEAWGQVLARPLWVPCEQSADDALQVAAALFWALTRRGFSPRAAPPPAPRPASSAPACRSPTTGNACLRLLNYNAWVSLLGAQVESARLLEVL